MASDCLAMSDTLITLMRQIVTVEKESVSRRGVPSQGVHSLNLTISFNPYKIE